MPATSPMPTLSQMQAWVTEPLETAASHWTSTAETWELAFTTVHRETPHPGGVPWRGEAADAAMLRTGTDRLAAVGARDCLHNATSAARYGAEEIQGARQLALEAVEEARAAGFSAAEDLSVTSRQVGGPPALQAARQTQAQAFAANIRSRAAALVTVDEQAASQITAAAAGLKGLSFEGSSALPDANADNRPRADALSSPDDVIVGQGSNIRGRVQMVDDGTVAPAPEPQPPSTVPPEIAAPPPGAPSPRPVTGDPIRLPPAPSPPVQVIDASPPDDSARPPSGVGFPKCSTEDNLKHLGEIVAGVCFLVVQSLRTSRASAPPLPGWLAALGWSGTGQTN